MAAARVDESSSSFNLTDHNIGLEPLLNTSCPFFLLGKTKIVANLSGRAALTSSNRL